MARCKELLELVLTLFQAARSLLKKLNQSRSLIGFEINWVDWVHLLHSCIIATLVCKKIRSMHRHWSHHRLSYHQLRSHDIVLGGAVAFKLVNVRGILSSVWMLLMTFAVGKAAVVLKFNQAFLVDIVVFSRLWPAEAYGVRNAAFFSNRCPLRRCNNADPTRRLIPDYTLRLKLSWLH